MGWSESAGIVGDSSVVLYLLYAANTFKLSRHRALAIQAGLHLIELGKPHCAGGVSWYGVDAASLKLSPETYFPNFEFGTAGVAFTLGRLYEETQEREFLRAASQGAQHLQGIATTHGTGSLVPYRFPDRQNVYYPGFRHGAAGTARLFYQLYKVTKIDSYLDWTERLARGAIDSEGAVHHGPESWATVCQRSGTAGLMDFLLGLSLATGNAEYSTAADGFASHVMDQNTDFDGSSYRWDQRFPWVPPSDISAKTGYHTGAAGIGAALLHTSLARQGRYQAIVFPDNPFTDRSSITARMPRVHA